MTCGPIYPCANLLGWGGILMAGRELSRRRGASRELGYIQPQWMWSGGERWGSWPRKGEGSVAREGSHIYLGMDRWQTMAQWWRSINKLTTTGRSSTREASMARCGTATNGCSFSFSKHRRARKAPKLVKNGNGSLETRVARCKVSTDEQAWWWESIETKGMGGWWMKNCQYKSRCTRWWTSIGSGQKKWEYSGWKNCQYKSRYTLLKL